MNRRDRLADWWFDHAPEIVAVVVCAALAVFVGVLFLSHPGGHLDRAQRVALVQTRERDRLHGAGITFTGLSVLWNHGDYRTSWFEEIGPHSLYCHSSWSFNGDSPDSDSVDCAPVPQPASLDSPVEAP